MPEDPAIKELAATLVGELNRNKRAVATAESCTGGWIAKALTDVPGSSGCFGYGIVSYSNGAKESMLGVKNRTLAEHGAVSESVVREMAEGALQLSGADIAVAVSGKLSNGDDFTSSQNFSFSKGIEPELLSIRQLRKLRQRSRQSR